MRAQINNLIKKERYRDCLELIFKSMNRRQMTELAIFVAELTLPFCEKGSRDPKKTIESAKRCLREDFSPESVKAIEDIFSIDPYSGYSISDYSAHIAKDLIGDADFEAWWLNILYVSTYTRFRVNWGNKKKISLKIIKEGLDILSPTSVEFMRGLQDEK